MFSLEGRVAVVTGGYSGLGKQISEALLEAGADVAVCARRVEKWEDNYRILQSMAAKEGRRLLGSRCDVRVEADVQDFFGKVASEFGAANILVNAAGIAWAAPPEDMKLEDWEKVLQTNLTGTFLCSQAAGRTMIANRGGSIINVSSVLGMYGSNPQVLDAIAYAASKAGIIGFTRDLAVKWAAHNIRVNALVPGWFVTHMTEKVVQMRSDRLIKSIPLGRLGSSTDLKGATILLASDASSYITGQIICIDGGLTAGR
jgi:NAD(P)-dependent dehydrogenase (short-subunit alcohol dehydrogenase family)